MKSVALLAAAFVVSAALAFIAKSSLISATEGVPANLERICLAALISEFGWSENPTGEKTRMGKYNGPRGDIHVFESRAGITECRVTGDRIVWRVPRGRWRVNQAFDTTLTYTIAEDSVQITSAWSDGSSRVESYLDSFLARLTQ